VIARPYLQVRRAWSDIRVLVIQVLQVPVEVGLEFRPVVGLDDHDPEGEPPPYLVHELDRRRLVAAVVDLEHPDAGAIVDGSELVEATSGARDALEELDVHLQPMAGLGLLVALPALFVRTMLLVRRQSAQAVAHEEPMHGRGGNRELVKSCTGQPRPVRRSDVATCRKSGGISRDAGKYAPQSALHPPAATP
jgi:hypothetical protein